MPTLQKRISYAGELRNAPVKNINLEFKIPVYRYFRVDTETGDGDKKIYSWDKEIVDTETIVVGKAINSKDYQTVLAEDFLVGKDRALFNQYFSRSLAEKRLENLFIPVNVDYVVDANYKIGAESLDLICLPKLNADRSDNTDSGARADSTDV